MKKLLWMIVLGSVFCLKTHAQIVMGQFLSDSSVGMAFEKGSYTSIDDVPMLNCWMAAVNSTPVRGSKPPVAGTPLSWTGYGERDKSIVLGSSFHSGVHGQRPLCYGFHRSINTGNLYLSFIIDLRSVQNRKYWTAVGFTSQVWGVKHWCCSVFYPAGNDGTTYNIGLRLAGGLMIVDRIFKTGEKHLVVLKYNIDNHKLSVFVDPDLSKPEPVPDEKVTAQIGDSDNVISGLYFRDVSDNVGNIGSFRVARVWEDIR